MYIYYIALQFFPTILGLTIYVMIGFGLRYIIAQEILEVGVAEHWSRLTTNSSSVRQSHLLALSFFEGVWNLNG